MLELRSDHAAGADQMTLAVVVAHVHPRGRVAANPMDLRKRLNAQAQSSAALSALLWDATGP